MKTHEHITSKYVDQCDTCGQYVAPQDRKPAPEKTAKPFEDQAWHDGTMSPEVRNTLNRSEKTAQHSPRVLIENGESPYAVMIGNKVVARYARVDVASMRAELERVKAYAGELGETIAKLVTERDQYKADADLWKRQSEFESEHREKYLQRCDQYKAQRDELLAACKRGLPWIGKMIANGGTRNHAVALILGVHMNQMQAAIQNTERK